MSGRRVAVIGLDGLEWWDVERMTRAGTMPHLEKVLSSATIARLSCAMPFRAESIWTEFFTGRGRDENRYWTTAEFDPSTYATFEAGAYRGAPFYARPDVTPIVFDLPHAPIAPEGRGIQVTGWGAHSPQFPTASLPSDVAPDIDRRFGPSRAMTGDSHTGWHSPRYQRALADALIESAATKADIVPWLLEREPDWNLLITVLTEPHVSGHQFWHGVDPSHLLHDTDHGARARVHHDEVMRATDEAIGEIMTSLPDDVDVVVMAVHGMQANGSDVTGGVLVSELLHRWHLGRPLIEFGGFDPDAPPIVLDEDTLPIEYLADRLVEPRGTMRERGRIGRLVRRTESWLRSHNPRLARPLEHIYWRFSGAADRRTWWEIRPRPAAEPFTDVAAATVRKPLDYQVPCWYRHHWRQMDSFVLPAFSDAHIRINLIGRETNGTVPATEYEAALDAVEELLHQCTDARTGEPIVDSTARPRADDPFDPDGPTSDLVVSFRTASDAIRHPELGVIGPAPLMRSGEHTPDGWMARIGSERSDIEVRFAPRDLAPTLLDLAGLPPSPMHTGSSFADRLR